MALRGAQGEISSCSCCHTYWRTGPCSSSRSCCCSSCWGCCTSTRGSKWSEDISICHLSPCFFAHILLHSWFLWSQVSCWLWGTAACKLQRPFFIWLQLLLLIWTILFLLCKTMSRILGPSVWVFLPPPSSQISFLLSTQLWNLSPESLCIWTTCLWVVC